MNSRRKHCILSSFRQAPNGIVVDCVMSEYIFHANRYRMAQNFILTPGSPYLSLHCSTLCWSLYIVYVVFELFKAHRWILLQCIFSAQSPIAIANIGMDMNKFFSPRLHLTVTIQSERSMASWDTKRILFIPIAVLLSLKCSIRYTIDLFRIVFAHYFPLFITQ